MFNIVLIGMPGCGKSVAGRLLAERTKRVFLDSDAVIEAEQGRTITQIFEQDGEAGFRRIEARVLLRLAEARDAVVATGGGAVLNGEVMQRLKRSGMVVYIDRPIDQITAGTDFSRRPLLTDGTDRIYALFSEREPLYLRYADAVAANRGELSAVISCILREMKIYENSRDKRS